MLLRDTQQATPMTRLSEYQAPAWRVDTVDLAFDLGIDQGKVSARLVVRCDTRQDEPLRLDGEHLELLSIALDGKPLSVEAWRYDGHVLEVDGVRDGSVLETCVRLNPAANSALEGLYLSGSRENGFLLTQCEAQGFRRVTFFPDRPDVLARYTVTLCAERKRFPVLLAGGNPDGSGELEDGRHWARFVDPYPKPSYLFALVAGKLEKIERDYTTGDGRRVKLLMWSEANAINRCHYALDALERAMRWDEQTYGRYYDLDVFHVVATHDFNMGAMENKGLNIFNAKYLLADFDSTTDEEYRAVEAVVAHEYFHNWSGNRVTCRDWFQLSLKEGFTVFREQSFSADMNSASLKRIEDVSVLRRTQFIEDAGPLAHPVRPDAYCEINNFYTATVYEKGAELVRMLVGRLGASGFRRGTDCYFARHDGHAATVEDFLAALGQANHSDLSPYLAWYGQAGTPLVRARGSYDPSRRQYTLFLSQYTPPSPGQPHKQPLPIPVKLALFGQDGQVLPLHMTEQSVTGQDEVVVVLDLAEQSFLFDNVAEAPVPSLLRAFSAPVILEYDYAPHELVLLLRHDVDGFNRWEASQQLAVRAFDALRDGDDDSALSSWCDALATLLVQADQHDDHALLARLLTPPSELELAERQNAVDPERIHNLRQSLLWRLAQRIGGEVLHARYQSLDTAVGHGLGVAEQAARQLKRCLLELLALADTGQAYVLAQRQYDKAQGMSDRLAALGVLVRGQAEQSTTALAHFRARYEDNALALEKWFMVQALVPGETALARVKQLETDPAFTLKNPNRMRSLIGTFVHANPSGFHRADGAAYVWLAQRLAQLDAFNPQVAARLATAYNGWKRLEPVRREAAHQSMTQLLEAARLSRNLREIMDKMLQN